MREPTPVYTNRLRCIECGRVAEEDERGWRAYLTTDEDESAEAVVYCVKCADQEFGEPRPKRI